MSDKMEDLFANFKKAIDSGNIPDDVKQMMNNLQGASNKSESNSSSLNNTNINNILSQISPDMLNNFSNMMNSSNNNSNQSSSDSNNINIDMNTVLKMKSIMDNINNKNDPRANLLYSLKPYLRNSKKNKLDQYVNMLNISKIADIMNKKEDNKNE